MHIRAKKNLGQNFLQDASVVRRIVDALEVVPCETVLEIGPGPGALTAELLERGARVIAIEFDREMIGHLRDRFGEHEGLALIQADALSAHFVEIANGETLKLAANLPYNISTALLQRFIETSQLWERLVLMFQKEVVERISARTGTASRGFMTVVVESTFDVEPLFTVPPGAFRPVPKVESAVARLTPKADASPLEDGFVALVSAAFKHKRKTLANNLRAFSPQVFAAAQDLSIDLGRRPETLEQGEWRELYQVIKKAGLV